MRMTIQASLFEHTARMYRVAVRIVGEDRAHDVVQDACVKALRAADRFNDNSSPATWLHRITVNCARDHLRADMRKKALHGSIELDGEMASMAAAIDSTPYKNAEKRELHEIAQVMVKSLPRDCRTAFVLTQLDGYSYDEAAVIENQPRGTIASRVFRAKKILMNKLSSRIDGRIQT